MPSDQELRELLNSLSEHFARVEREMADMRGEIARVGVAAEPEPVALTPVPEPVAVAPEPVPEPAVSCPSCGFANDAGWHFCMSCGHALTEVPAAPVEAVVARPAPVAPAPAVVPAPTAATPAGPTLIERLRGDLSWWEFFGRRVLVWVAGVVIVIGLVLLYRKAVEAGWVGPAGRVALGTGLSLAMLGAGFVLRRRYASDDGALVAAGTAVAGLYASLFAAVRMYDLIGSAAGMPFAFLIAAVAVVIALRWSSQPLAMLGLAGAALAPPLVSQTVSPLSMSFVAIAAAAGGLLWLRRDWLWLVGLTTAISLPQALAMLGLAAGDGTAFGWTVVWQSALVATAYWGLYQALVIGRRRGHADERLDLLCGWTAIAAAAFALYAAGVLFDGTGRGYAMLAVAAAYLGLTALLWEIELGHRDLMTISWAAAVTAGTIGLMILLGGSVLVVALALEGVLHLVVSRRLDEPRMQISAAALLGLAAVFGLVQAPPSVLASYPPDALIRGGSVAGDLVRSSIVSVIAVAAAMVTFAALRRPVYAWAQRGWQLATFWTAVAGVLYAVSTVIIDLFLWLDGGSRSFQNAHTTVSAAWALIALGMVYASFRRHAADVRLGGLLLFAAALVKLFFYDLQQLESMARAVSFIAVGLILLVGGVLYRQLALREAEDDRRHGGGPRPIARA